MSEPSPAAAADRDLLAGLIARGASPLRSADRLAGLGTLVAGMAHELNNPITYVLGNLGQLERLAEGLREAVHGYRTELERALGPAAGPAVQRAQEKLEQAGGLELMDALVSETLEGAGRIRDTVREVLSYARGQGSEHAALSIHDVLDFNLRMLKPELARATLVREYRATRAVQGSRSGLGQALLNLIRNAIQACASGNPARDQIAVRTRDATAGVEIEVADSGPGIPTEIRPHLFTPFFTTRAESDGTGLGLYITRIIIEEHGGSIDFTCPVTGGARFRVFLPERRS